MEEDEVRKRMKRVVSVRVSHSRLKEDFEGRGNMMVVIWERGRNMGREIKLDNSDALKCFTCTSNALCSTLSGVPTHNLGLGCLSF